MIEPTDAKLDNLHIGQKIEFTEVISESMVEKFAKLSGDIIHIIWTSLTLRKLSLKKEFVMECYWHHYFLG